MCLLIHCNSLGDEEFYEYDDDEDDDAAEDQWVDDGDCE